MLIFTDYPKKMLCLVVSACFVLGALIAIVLFVLFGFSLSTIVVSGFSLLPAVIVWGAFFSTNRRRISRTRTSHPKE